MLTAPDVPARGSRAPGQPRLYDAARMYGAAGAFAGSNHTYLRGVRPQVLRLGDRWAPRLLDPDLGVISGPPSLGLPARAREMGVFNPGLVRAPANLCPRCKYVVSLRVDPLHQCHEKSPLLHKEQGMPRRSAANAYFKGTAIAVLDSELRTLGWTWFINAPQHQVKPEGANPSRWFVSAGAADAFEPPWGKAVYDVRLVNIAEHLFATFVCRSCPFSVAQLQLAADATPDGGLRNLRAWQSRRFTTSVTWAQGRNQALFTASRAGGPAELMVQPWLGLVASLGAPEFGTESVSCGAPAAFDGDATGEKPLKRAGFRTCGATPLGSRLHLDVITNAHAKGGFGRLELISNTSRREIQRSAVGGARLSTTSNLLRVARIVGGRRCDFYVGVGHLHRGEGSLNRVYSGDRGARRRTTPPKRPPRGGEEAAGAGVFMWGHHYTHFFYALEPKAPFRTIATSGEFCIQSVQDASDCESIQFVSSISWEAAGDGPQAGGGAILLAYGVNDCEAKVARLPVERLVDLLLPLGGPDGMYL